MKTSTASKIFDVCNYIFLILLAVVTLFPFWIIVMSTFVSAGEYYTKTFVLWPSAPTLAAYKFLFSTNWIWTGYRATIYTTVCGTLYTMFLVSTAAFAMTNNNLPGKKFFSWFFLFTMYFGGGLIPWYLLIAQTLKLNNSYLSLWLTSGLSVWSFLVLRNFFRGIPPDLRESAMLDGASELTILWRIILPLSLPAIATLTLFSAVSYWNSWTNALYFINSNDKQPLPIILRKMIQDDRIKDGNAGYVAMERAYLDLMGGEKSTVFDVAIKNATITVTALPIMLLYPFFQKYFAKGVLVGSIKG